MKKLVVVQKDNDNYFLESGSDKYRINIDFLGNVIKPNINDFFYINDSLLSKIDKQMVTFGDLKSPYGRAIKSADDEDIIFIEYSNQTKVCLKRLYG